MLSIYIEIFHFYLPKIFLAYIKNILSSFALPQGPLRASSDKKMTMPDSTFPPNASYVYILTDLFLFIIFIYVFPFIFLLKLI